MRRALNFKQDSKVRVNLEVGFADAQ